MLDSLEIVENSALRTAIKVKDTTLDEREEDLDERQYRLELEREDILEKTKALLGSHQATPPAITVERTTTKDAVRFYQCMHKIDIEETSPVKRPLSSRAMSKELSVGFLSKRDSVSSFVSNS